MTAACGYRLLGVFQQPLALIILQKYCDANGSHIVMHMGGAQITPNQDDGSVALEMEGVSWCFEK